MYTCNCRAVSEHTVRSVLADFFKGILIIPRRRGDAGHQTQRPNNLDDLHEACSGGEGFNCGKCACDWVDLAREHNRNITLQQLKDSLPGAATPAEPVKAPAAPKTEPV